jgi:hypothetical protein
MDTDNIHPDAVAVEQRDSGRIVRGPDGRFLPGTRPGNIITPANARELAAKRHEAYRRAAVRRIVGEAESIDPSVSTGADAYALVASRQYVALMDHDKPRIEDLERLGALMTDYSPRQQQHEQQADDPLRELGARVLEYIAARAQSIVMRTVDGGVDVVDDGEAHDTNYAG